MAAIRDWPRPTSKKEVKLFLGLVGYYRRFIPGFATLASPLNDLTRKALPDRVTWSEAVVLRNLSSQELYARGPS